MSAPIFVWCSDDTLTQYELYPSGEVTEGPSALAIEYQRMLDNGGEEAEEAKRQLERVKRDLPYKGRSWYPEDITDGYERRVRRFGV